MAIAPLLVLFGELGSNVGALLGPWLDAGCLVGVTELGIAMFGVAVLGALLGLAGCEHREAGIGLLGAHAQDKSLER